MSEKDISSTAPAIEDDDASAPDPFANAKPVPGLEHLGRAVVDENGAPSGSPANYEATRGRTGKEPDAAAIADMVDKIGAEFAAGITDDDEE